MAQLSKFKKLWMTTNDGQIICQRPKTQAGILLPLSASVSQGSVLYGRSFVPTPIFWIMNSMPTTSPGGLCAQWSLRVTPRFPALLLRPGICRFSSREELQTWEINFLLVLLFKKQSWNDNLTKKPIIHVLWELPGNNFWRLSKWWKTHLFTLR